MAIHPSRYPWPEHLDHPVPVGRTEAFARDLREALNPKPEERKR